MPEPPGMLGSYIRLYAEARREIERLRSLRRILSEEERLEVIRRREAGEKIDSIAADFDMHKSAVSHIMTRHKAKTKKGE